MHTEPMGVVRINSTGDGTHMTGITLWLARLGWAAVVLLVLASLSEMVRLNRTMTYSEWYVTQARPALPGFITYGGFVAYLTILESAVALLSITAGLIVFRYRSNEWMGLLVSAMLVSISLMAISSNADVWRFPRWLAWLDPITRILVFLTLGSFLLFFFLFPDGRFRPRWTRWLAVPGFLVILLLAIGPLLVTEETQANTSAADEELVWSIMMIALITSFISAVAAQVYRYRTTTNPAHRQQMKWVVFGLGAWLSGLVWEWLAALFLPNGWDAFIGSQYALFVLALVPISIVFSIFRYRLWDVDVIINRALVYGGLTTLIVGLYALIVGGVSTLFQAQATAGANLLALLAVILLAPFLFRRLQSGVSRLVPVSLSAGTGEPGSVQAATEGTILHGRSLWLARAGWGGTTLLALFLFVASMQMARAENLFARMSDLAAEVDVLLFQVFANDIYLSSRAVLTAAYIQFAVFVLVGLVLFWRRANDWLVILASTMLITSGAGFSPAMLFLPVLQPAWHIPVTLLQIILFSSLIVFLYLFPDGRFVPRWTRYAFGLWLSFAATWLFFPQANPHRAATATALLVFIIWAWSGLAAQADRYRRISGPLERLQAKWVVFGFLATQAAFSLLIVPAVLGVTPRLEAAAPLLVQGVNSLLGLSAVLIPITIGLAILRYRLWEFNLILNRTLVYGGLTAAILLAYILVVGVLSLLFQPEENTLLSIVVTGLIAIMFNPMRQRLQQGVNRLMYGYRDDPVTVLSRLGEQLQKSAAPADTLPILVETVSHALKLPYVAIALRDGETFPIVAEYAAFPAENERETEVFPLVYQSELVGQLLVTTRTDAEPFSPADRRLLDNIARQAGPAAHAAQLTDQLQRSRQRLVTTREEERRRLRRDLHDGLGPQLATLALKVDAARNQLSRDPATTERILGELKEQIQHSIQDIRRLVYELRPPALDQLGLVSAIHQFVATQNRHEGSHFTIQAPEVLPALPAAVEVAAYRITLEAVTNIARHAHARHGTIRLAIEDDLILEICDDGNGLPPSYVSGVGLASMRERAAELGGTFAVESPPGGGTAVRVYLPLTHVESI